MENLKYITIFIGNRDLVIDFLLSSENKLFILKKIFCLKNSRLDNYLKVNNNKIPVEYFELTDKDRIIEELQQDDFDMLISNGCPFLLPIARFNKNNKYFINVHPTYLPYLKGITGINGVFFNKMKFFGATVHHIDEGIDTGRIISQKKIKTTEDLDIGLIYYLSFQAELLSFIDFYNQIKSNGKIPAGVKQRTNGSYFKREKWMRVLKPAKEKTEELLKKIKSFGIKSQGCFLNTANKSYKIFDAEEIINEFILNKFSSRKPGDILLDYDNKILIKTVDGILKIKNYESFS